MVDLRILSLQQNVNLYDLHSVSHIIRVPASWE
jgi:hypothetical protein